MYVPAIIFTHVITLFVFSGRYSAECFAVTVVAKIAAIDVLHVIRIPFMVQIPDTIQILLYIDYLGVCPE